MPNKFSPKVDKYYRLSIPAIRQGFFVLQECIYTDTGNPIDKRAYNKKKLNSFIYQVRPNFTLSNKNVIDVSTRLKDEIPKV